MKKILVALLLTLFASPAFAAVEFPAGTLECKTTTCFSGGCENYKLSFKVEGGLVKEAKLNGEDQDGYFDLVKMEAKEDANIALEPEFVKIWFGGDGHEFFVVDLYVSQLAKLAKGELEAIHGKFYQGFEWGDYEADEIGVIKCSAVK